MRRSVKLALLAAYDSAMSMAQIRRKWQLSDRTVQRFWADAKSDGRLPDRPRLHFAERCGAVAFASEIDVLDAEIGVEDFAADDAPIGGPLGLRIPDGDPLLCALRLVHGADPWRRLDGMPDHTLAMELDGHAPSRARVAELAATRDVYVGALMRRQPQGVH